MLAIFSGIFVVRPVTRRLTQLAEATRPVAAGDLSVRVYAKGDDEIAALGRAFNRMLERLELSTRIEFQAHWAVANNGAQIGSRDQKPAHAHSARGRRMSPAVRSKR